MCRKRLTCCLIDQLFCISMICTDEHLSVHFFQCIHCFSYTLIHCFDRFDRCIFYSSMSDHIRICKIDNDHIIFVRFDRIYQLIAYFICTHLRFQIISCHFWRFYKDSVFSLVWFFYSTVEEECYMCIFFSLCNTSLCHVVCCQKFTECICDLFFYKCYLLILDRHIILCKAYKCCLDSLSSVKSFKVIITECSCDLSCTVWAEVEEDHRISIFYSCHRCTVFYDHHWFYELICLICIVRSLNPCCRRFCLYAFSFYQCIVSSLHTIPAVISVHSRASTYSFPDAGGVSRPSRKQCTYTFSTPCLFASSRSP